MLYFFILAIVVGLVCSERAEGFRTTAGSVARLAAIVIVGLVLVVEIAGWFLGFFVKHGVTSWMLALAVIPLLIIERKRIVAILKAGRAGAAKAAATAREKSK